MKKILSKTNIILLLIALCAMLFCGLFAISNFASKNSSANAYQTGSSATLIGYYDKNNQATDSTYGNFWYRSLNYDIANLIITNDVNKKPADDSYLQAPDVSLAQDGSLLAYVVNSETSGYYDCIIYGDVETIYAPEFSDTLFAGCCNYGGYDTKLRNVKSIVFENFDTSKVTSMNGIFDSCAQVTSLDLSGWNTSNVTNMSNMFNGCRALSSVNVSNFDTSSVKEMGYMFQYCSNLTALDLSSFNTQSVTNMDLMFALCQQLRTLDLSNFDTSQVTSMSEMFSYCTKLRELNISNFTISSSCSTSSMFSNSTKLEKLVAPKQCDVSITLPSTMLEDGTETAYSALSSATNGKTLVVNVDAVLVNNWSVSYGLNYDIANITITVDEGKIPSNPVQTIDVSEARNEGVIAYILENNGAYDCIIYGVKDVIYAPSNSSYLFSTIDNTRLKNLKSINFECFVVKEGTTIDNFFTGTTKLDSIYAPTECNVEIALPKPFTEQNTTTEYTSLSSATNGKTLVYNPTKVVLSQSLGTILSPYSITKLSIANNSNAKPGNYDAIVDVSYYQDGYANAYIVGTNCVIYSELPIYSPTNSSMLFGILTLENLDLTNLNTTLTTNMSNMFASKSHDITIKGYCGVMGAPEIYQEDMTFLEFGQAMGLDTTDMTDDDVKADLEAETGLKFAQAGSYDLTIEACCLLIGLPYTNGMTYKDFYAVLQGEFDGTEEQCKAELDNMLGCSLADVPEGISLTSLTTLNISGFVINEGTSVENMLTGLTNLKTLYAPAECNEEITLPATMYKEGTSTEYASLSNSTNSLVLLDTANGTVSDEETTTPTTCFVDEQLLPALAVGFVSIMAVAIVISSNKKRKYN